MPENVLGLSGANSLEMNEMTPHPVIHYMEGQKNIADIGGTSRLGAYPCEFKKDTKSFSIYGAEIISERHRHRFEFNNQYIELFEKAGMIVAGICPSGGQVEDNGKYMSSMDAGSSVPSRVSITSGKTPSIIPGFHCSSCKKF